MKLCRLCRVATYCCDEHGSLDWRAHRSLCKELRWPDDKEEVKEEEDVDDDDDDDDDDNSN